jgi:hypothetical protein
MDCNDGKLHRHVLFAPHRPGAQGTAIVGEDEYSKQPDSATIIGAAKLTGARRLFDRRAYRGDRDGDARSQRRARSATTRNRWSR